MRPGVGIVSSTLKFFLSDRRTLPPPVLSFHDGKIGF